MQKIAAAVSMALLCAAQPSLALEVHTVENDAGSTVFELRFFDPADGPYIEYLDFRQESTWAWEPQLREQVLQGAKYWAQILKPQGDQGPAIINVGTDDERGNASASSPQAETGGVEDSRTVLQRHFQGLPIDPDNILVGAHGRYVLGPSDFPVTYRYTQIPLSGHDDLVATSIHELAHGLGFASLITTDDDDEHLPRFDEVLGGWAPLMRDDHGRPGKPGQAILCEGCNHAYDPDAFDVRADRGLLVGPHIAEVLDGGMPGIPISMYLTVAGQRYFDDNNMSHSELRNSMMSHQYYRNYVGVLEAEMAVMQDLGYTIDRRNFFGRSVYGSGLDIVSDWGFHARNPEGTAYLPGEYNTSILGLGLHVYGSHNRIRQVADLLTAGEGGAGIRVDGEGNAIIIDPGVRVHANGLVGQGVMFTYGRNHTLVLRGEVEAVGAHGVGLRFDFGDNALMNSVEYRGSYIHTILGRLPIAPAPELQGPLVSRADITGRVAGSEAAIHISRNAYVGEINVMQGARIEGDIVSHYAQRDEAGERRLTRLSFGRSADAQGRATDAPDPAFRMAYDGSIRGRDNLALSFDGGETRLSGHHEVHGVTVRPRAGLAGATAFELADDGLFLNEGRLAPGASIGRMAIGGDFRQTPSGRLQVEFDAGGEHDVLEVSGSVDLAGTLELAPAQDWYGSAWRLQTERLITGDVQQGRFDTVSFALDSPTLGFDAQPLGGERYLLAAARAPDAYSRHGADGNAQAVGRALEAALPALPADMQPFVRAMDFSAPDGSEVGHALALASPQGYSAGLAASIMRERDVLETAMRGLGEGFASGAEWKGFAVAFGGEGRQDHRGSALGYDATTYGLVVGGGRALAAHPDISVGLHLDIAEQSVSLKSPQWGKAKTTAVGLGAQVQYQPDPLAGLHAHGVFRVGVEQGSMDRKSAVGDYYAAHSADWTGHSASVQAGAGYRWRLSPTVSVGPLASLNYARVSRPGVEESGPGATRLALESQRFDALRSSFGMGAVMRQPLEDGAELSAHAQVSWDHEWLDRDVEQTARFAAAPGVPFQSRNAVLPRNSLGLRAGLAWQRSESFSVGAGLGGRLGSGYRSLEGQLALRWAF